MMEQGYDVELASGEAIDPKYICPVCLTVMRNAMQTCCGHRFCRSCILGVVGQRQWGKCPVDKTIFQRNDMLFSDVAIQREVLSLVVSCKNSHENCAWNGELRELEKHIKVCPVELIDCPDNCLAKFQRGQLDNHREQCPLRRVTCTHCEQEVIFSQLHKHELLLCEKFPVTCKLCGEANILRKDISKHVDSTYGSCPQSNMVCKFLGAGCHFQDKRMNMHNHYEENLDQHMSLLMSRLMTLAASYDTLREDLAIAKRQMAESDQQISKHAFVLEQLKERTNGRVQWRLDLNMEPDPTVGFSPPFYTSCPGYKMRFRLDFNGVRDGEDYYTSVFIVLQRGQFDDELLFPFHGKIKITLLSQASGPVEGRENISVIINCMDVPRNTSGSANARINSRGLTRFMKKSDLMAPPYCINKILFFEIAMVLPCDSLECMNTNLGRPVTSSAPSLNP